jgi:putative addiction module component (TIGR02574 family)
MTQLFESGGLPVGSRAEEVLEQAMNLPERERLQLAELLLASVGSTEAPPFDAAWIAEAKRRAARIDAGEGKLSAWPEVRDRARRSLGGQAGG